MSFRHCFLAWLVLLLGHSSSRSEEEATPFSIQPSEPYLVAEANAAHSTQITTNTNSVRVAFSADEIARIAARNCGPANLIVRENAITSSTGCRNDVDQATIREIRSASAQRIRENSASIALKLHYGLAASKQLQDILSRTRQELDRQTSAQRKLIEEGIPIQDPLLLDRLILEWNDQSLENESKQRTLRIQLSELVGNDIACRYEPLFDMSLSPSDVDICDYLQTAMSCRQELSLLYRLRKSIDESAIELWESIAGALSGMPIFRSQPLGLTGKIKRMLFRSEIEQAVQNRKQWLETLIQERTNHIRREIEVSYEAKRVAALRWANSQEQRQSWETRIRQLEKLGDELKGNLVDQSSAKLQALQSEGATIKRWLDWHLANVDLANAAGTLLQKPIP